MAQANAEVSRLWQALAPEDRAPFEAEARELRSQHVETATALPFQLFVRKLHDEGHPLTQVKGVGPRTRQIAELWRSLSEAERAAIEQEASQTPHARPKSEQEPRRLNPFAYFVQRLHKEGTVPKDAVAGARAAAALWRKLSPAEKERIAEAARDVVLAPKKAKGYVLSPTALFRRQLYKQGHPGVTGVPMAQANAEVSRLWRELSPEDRAQFKAEAQELRLQRRATAPVTPFHLFVRKLYAEAHPATKVDDFATRTRQIAQLWRSLSDAERAAVREEAANTLVSQSLPSERVLERMRSSAPPARALFRRQLHKQGHPAVKGVPMVQSNAEVSRLWRELSPVERAEFEAEAQELRAQRVAPMQPVDEAQWEQLVSADAEEEVPPAPTAPATPAVSAAEESSPADPKPRKPRNQRSRSFEGAMVGGAAPGARPAQAGTARKNPWLAIVADPPSS